MDEVNKAKITVNEEIREGRKVKHVEKVLNYEGYVKRFLQIVLDHVDGTETPELGPIDVVVSVEEPNGMVPIESCRIAIPNFFLFFETV